jgi:succinyl-diaminopimelate desuccinylase
LSDTEDALVESVPASSIEALASGLVSIPSQAGTNRIEPILDRMAHWLGDHQLKPERLLNESGEVVALVARIVGSSPGPSLCLNACLDTAPIGNPALWSFSPTDGMVRDGRLRGRGAADSKIGASILAHVVERLAGWRTRFSGTLYLLFDADEHTGRFGGVRSFIRSADPRPDAAVLGYAGNDSLTIGARGFYRAQLTVSGKAAHSGAAARKGINAVAKIAKLVTLLDNAKLPANADEFPLAPAVTVTEVSGGSGFTHVPDQATCRIDIRIPPAFDAAAVRAWLEERIRQLDTLEPSPIPTILAPEETWPAYAVDRGSSIVQSFLRAGEAAFGRPINTEICGPSNIGNYLSTLGVQTICGLGVAYQNLHAADEVAEMNDVAASFRSYVLGVLSFMSPPAGT